MSLAAPLTIRNLTSTPLELKVIERYDRANPLKKGVENISHNVTTLGRGHAKHDENDHNFESQGVSIRIAPFTIQKTEIACPDHAKETLRLTFEYDGQRYRIDTPQKNESQAFVPLATDPKRQYVGIFLQQHGHLAIYSSAKLSCWMKELKDSTPLSGISIPGTHNSPTYHRALPSVRCQAVSPREQLDNGVRFFDIRVQPKYPNDPKKDTLILVHGVFPISLTGSKTFRSLVTDAEAFLQQNPSETVIISLKREGTGPATDAQLSTIVHDHYANPEKNKNWYTEPRVPSLGEVRGKIVLVRRFGLDERVRADHEGGWGLDAENWADNTADDTHGAVRVQDFYEVLEPTLIEKKSTYALEHLARAAECVVPIPGVTTDVANPLPPGPLFLNFLSASNFFKIACWPEKVAAKLNPAVVEYLCTQHHAAETQNGDGSTGVVVCDWVGGSQGWDLVKCIVGMNALLERERGL
ncbi:phosphatidylinositol phospholipase C [Phyllosticta citrichinensis]|uniref:Phosphatidylinositol phospholipase C n=1 Tax=Phyllosticta citrichinensis TaxID=1130410 RepID=A0ABR1XUI6_9PEZI